MATPDDRTGHPFHMYDELHAQPEAMAAALAGDEEQRDHIAKELAGTHSATESIVGPGFLVPHFVGRGRIWLAGCGTAYHAALTGAEWFRRLSGGLLDVQVVQSFEFAHYIADHPRPHDAFLALSHSGTPTATVAAAERAKSLGMYTVALTGAAESPVTLACDETVITTTASTLAATYTISHTTMLAVLGDLAIRAAEHLRASQEQAHELADDFARLPDLARAVLSQEDAMRAIVAALPANAAQFIAAGAHVNWHTALEAALKIREAAYMPGAGMELEEVLHGPFSSFDDQTVLLLIVPPDIRNGDGAASLASASRDRALDILRAAATIGATTIAFGAADDKELAAGATHFFALPMCPEIVSVVPATVAAQLLTYWLAMRRGGNPDRIRRDQPAWQAARASYTR